MKKMKFLSMMMLMAMTLTMMVACGGDDGDDNSLPFTKEILVNAYFL